MKVLFIGGTGNISTSCSFLALEKGIDLYHLNREMTKEEIPGVISIKADIHNKEEMLKAIGEHDFDVVVDWIAFTQDDVERDYEIFKGKIKQFIFISSASAYQKPLSDPRITESTPLANPIWKYSQNKIACEDYLLQKYRKWGFPITIVRPSHTYRNMFPVTRFPFLIDSGKSELFKRPPQTSIPSSNRPVFSAQITSCVRSP